MKKYFTRSILISLVGVSTISIGLEFIKAERNRKFASQTGSTYRDVYKKDGSVRAPFPSLPKSLTYQIFTFPQEDIDDFLDSDAEEMYSSKLQLSRDFAKSIQKYWQLDPYSKTYFTVQSFIEIRHLVFPAIMFFVSSIAYIVLTEVKEIRRRRQ
jgi:hypothetical protein